MLQPHASSDIGADENCLRCTVHLQVQHFDGIAQVKVVDLVARQSVHRGKSVGSEQVINRGSQRSLAGITRWQAAVSQLMTRTVSLREKSALNRERLKLQQVLDLLGRQRGV